VYVNAHTITLGSSKLESDLKNIVIMEEIIYDRRKEGFQDKEKLWVGT
jgi:hypothetical protein